MAMWSRAAVLKLYCSLLCEGHQLKYTDHEFYLSFVQWKFHKNKDLIRPEDKERQLEKGMFFFQNKLGGLV
ncbi:MIEF1 upstream open reading frame protein-like [Protopterus annectens]|uniref:MIEF1 upstream open reading frame protein-like n=1 Tax=Protopterus annectens TaxID=7888 RepID=UPI001CFB18D4|nr:MIEF1 upstream open reading frame protein-like [Protopterus annectens]